MTEDKMTEKQEADALEAGVSTPRGQRERELDTLLTAAKLLVEQDHLKADLAVRKKRLDALIKTANSDYDRARAILVRGADFMGQAYQVGDVAVSVTKRSPGGAIQIEIVKFHAERATTPA